jgi:hypothetical protein
MFCLNCRIFLFEGWGFAFNLDVLHKGLGINVLQVLITIICVFLTVHIIMAWKNKSSKVLLDDQHFLFWRFFILCFLKPVTAAVWAGGCPGGATNPIFGFLIGELSPHQGWTDRSILTDSPVELRRKYSLYLSQPAMNWEERISRIFCILRISRTNWIFICRIFPPKLRKISNSETYVMRVNFVILIVQTSESTILSAISGT